MSTLTIMFALLSIATLVHVFGLLASRRGSSGKHRWLMICGIAGLVSLPVMVLSAVPVALAFLVASLDSLPGYVLVLSLAVLCASTVASIILQLLVAYDSPSWIAASVETSRSTTGDGDN